MKRFNYRQSPFDQLLGATPLHAVMARLRLPIGIAGAAVLAIAAIWSFEVHRLATLDADLATLQAHVEAARPDSIRAERLRTTVARLAAANAQIAAARRETLAATNTIAEIGNGLPARTWLTGLGATPAGNWTVGGRSTRVDEIGTMLRRIQNIDTRASAHLVSIAATGRSGHILDFVIAWDRLP